jgi:hypothetical protein
MYCSSGHGLFQDKKDSRDQNQHKEKLNTNVGSLNNERISEKDEEE